MNGKYNISVVYGGYGNYNSITKTTTLNIVKQVSTKITITTTSVISGQSTVLTAKVTDSSGNLVSGGKAVFKLNGKTIGKMYAIISDITNNKIKEKLIIFRKFNFLT